MFTVKDLPDGFIFQMKDRIIKDCYQIEKALYVLTEKDPTWEKLKRNVKKDI